MAEYLVSGNASDAYRKAGYSATAADANSARMMANDRVAAIAEAQRARAERLGIDADAVLQRLWDTATAEPTKLTMYRVGACRYCWGADHAYQWKTLREHGAAAGEDQTRLVTDAGGFGYRITRAANPDCPECDGLGVPFVQFADTRALDRKERLLFEGVKQSKNGVEFKLADRLKALELVARHLGMFREIVQHDVTDELSEMIQAAQGTPFPIGTSH